MGVFPKRQQSVDKSSFICLQSGACNINANRGVPMRKNLADKDVVVTERSPIVSSAHLVSPQSAEMSEFEFGLIVAGNAFHRWIAHCMSAAGLKDLTPLDVLVLHHVTHRARDKRLADICFIMNVEDTHLINYSLKKLQNLKVVEASKNGKEVTYASTEVGRSFVQRYREIRESCLINAMNADDALNRDIGELARLLRVLSGMYDQAARAAASL
jgi:predicted MarR family transcription regulator